MKPAASSQHWPQQHSWWHRGTENTLEQQRPCSSHVLTCQPRSPLCLCWPTLQQLRIGPVGWWDVSEIPGSAPRPSRKHDSATSQSKPLMCISETRSLAPRQSPTGAAAWSLHHVQHKIQTRWGQHGHGDSDAVCKPPLRAALRRNQQADQDDISMCRGFSLKSCLNLSKACTLASRQHVVDQLPQQPPPSRVSLVKRGTSFCAADVTPHPSPLRSATERMKLFFASCIFQDSVSRKKPFCATARKVQHKLPLSALQLVLFSLQPPTWPKPKKRLRYVFLQS